MKADVEMFGMREEAQLTFPLSFYSSSSLFVYLYQKDHFIFWYFGSIPCTTARDSRLLQRLLLIHHYILVQTLEYIIVILNILYCINKIIKDKHDKG